MYSTKCTSNLLGLVLIFWWDSCSPRSNWRSQKYSRNGVWLQYICSPSFPAMPSKTVFCEVLTTKDWIRTWFLPVSPAFLNFKYPLLTHFFIDWKFVKTGSILSCIATACCHTMSDHASLADNVFPFLLLRHNLSPPQNGSVYKYACQAKNDAYSWAFFLQTMASMLKLRYAVKMKNV